MRIKKKIAASLIVFTMMMELAMPGVNLFCGLIAARVLAAETIELRVARDGDNYLITANTVTLEWDRVTGAMKYIITWDDLSGSRDVTVNEDEGIGNKYIKLIDMLSPDVVYNFNIEAFDGLDQPIGATGQKKIITKITFSVERLDETAADVPPDGKEVGNNPSLTLDWKIPRVASGDTIYYSDPIDTDIKPSYRINIGTDKSASNKKAIFVDYDPDAGKYTAKLDSESGSVVTDDVIYYDTPGAHEGHIRFTIDKTTYPDLTPGTIYYMNIIPVFEASDPVQFKRSSLEGGYAYTPLRFHITRDHFNNLIITIYKVNQSSKESSELASFTYEVHSALPEDENFYDFDLEAKESDLFSQNVSTMVVFVGGKASTHRYRVIAKAPAAGEELMSNHIVYTITEDTNKAPMPEDFAVVGVTPVTANISGFDVKSGKVRLKWKKPSNYTALFEEKTTYYHFLLNTAQSDMKEEDNSTYKKETINISENPQQPEYKEFEIKYRDVFSINIANSDIEVVDTPQGSTLEYELNGFELFKQYNADGTTVDLPNADDYPERLLPNKVYFIKMFSTREIDGAEDISDACVAQSFTTPPDVLKNPPVPEGFRVAANSIDENGNIINLEWNKVYIDIKDYTSQSSATYEVYYDLYMSNSLDENSFILAGSSSVSGDIDFEGDDNPGATIVSARIRDFSEETEMYERFGNGLKPNVTYYFKIKTGLAISGETSARSSEFSAVLAVTTERPPIVEPGEEGRRPLAPTDFSIDIDEGNNQVISGNSVRLRWTDLEPGVTYRLIRTAFRIDANADIEEIAANVNNNLNEYEFPPTPAPGTNYTYDAENRRYRFLVDDIFPNTLYYFSLRAEKVINQGTPEEEILTSVWVTVPVTTLIIQAPERLEAMRNVEIGTSWTADEIFTSDDFTVSISTERDEDFKTLPKHEISITEEDDGIAGTNTFYARIVGLEASTRYYLRVEGMTMDPMGNRVNYPETVIGPISTRNRYYQIEARWIGGTDDNFSVAIKEENDVNYTELLESDFTLTSEKTQGTVGTSSKYYYARISRINGQRLKAGKKYFIKVRTYRINEEDGSINYSKYIGPVDIRTDFRQEDYDDEKETETEEVEFRRSVNELKKRLEWRLKNSRSSYEIIIRSSMANSLIDNDTEDNEFVVDLTDAEYSGASSRGAYIPLEIIEKLNSLEKNLSVKSAGAEFTFRPWVINTDTIEEITYMKEKNGVREVFIFIGVDKINPSKRPYGVSTISDVYSLQIKVIGANKTEQTIENNICAELEELADSYIARLRNIDEEEKDTAKELRDVINDLVEDIDDDLTDFGYDLMYKDEPDTIYSTKQINILSGPVNYRLKYTAGNGYKTAYIYTASRSSWEKISTRLIESSNEAVFESIKPVSCAVMMTEIPALNSAYSNHWAKKDILAFISKIDISDVFDDIQKINPDEKVSVEQAIRLVEKVTKRKTGIYKNVDIESLAEDMGINRTINAGRLGKKITREEMAGLVIKIYCVKSGMSDKNLKPKGNLKITDEWNIEKKYYNHVLLALELGLMTIDADGNFMPAKEVSIAEMFIVLNRLMDLSN